MIIIISDLHLADTSKLNTINIARFFRSLRNIVNQAQMDQIQELTLLILGDFIELLRSKTWLQNEIRPWEKCSPKHIETVKKIFENIVSTNNIFFKELNELITEFPFLKLEYIPGNHDRIINTEMGHTARVALQKVLSFEQSDGEQFKEYYFDPKHGVIAKHGHEEDLANRYINDSVAIGDAVVIDILLRLPKLMAEALKIDEDHKDLEFIHELDRVRPQHPRVMAKWLINGIDIIKETYPPALNIIEDSLQIITNDFLKLIKETQFEATRFAYLWIEPLYKTMKLAMKHFGTLRMASKVPGHKKKSISYKFSAFQDIGTTLSLNDRFRFVIYGHTHFSEVVPLQVGVKSKNTPLYINTGTWQKIHRIANIPNEKEAIFSTWHEECIVCIRSFEECKNDLPQFEIYRFANA
jgi:UDP-2,3-diacylglucosamine pyrophosphatase LpxH